MLEHMQGLTDFVVLDMIDTFVEDKLIQLTSLENLLFKACLY